MATATIVKVWKDDVQAYMAVRVQELDGAVEYIGSVPLDDLKDLKAAEQKAALVAAVKASRDKQQKPALSSMGIVGTVTI